MTRCCWWARRPRSSKAMEIYEVVSELKNLSERSYDRYLFENDTVSGRIPEEEKATLAEEARRCGQEAAGQLGFSCDSQQFRQLESSVEIRYFEDVGSEIYPMVFASFKRPNLISLNQVCIERAEQFYQEQSLTPLIGVPDIRRILLMHELFHYIEYSTPGIYTQTKRWTGRGIFGKPQQLPIHALGEIAGSAFVEAMLPLGYSPQIFDVLFQWMMDETRGKRLARLIFSRAGNQTTAERLETELKAAETQRRSMKTKLGSLSSIWKIKR